MSYRRVVPLYFVMLRPQHPDLQFIVICVVLCLEQMGAAMSCWQRMSRWHLFISNYGFLLCLAGAVDLEPTCLGINFARLIPGASVHVQLDLVGALQVRKCDCLLAFVLRVQADGFSTRCRNPLACKRLDRIRTDVCGRW